MFPFYDVIIIGNNWANCWLFSIHLLITLYRMANEIFSNGILIVVFQAIFDLNIYLPRWSEARLRYNLEYYPSSPRCDRKVKFTKYPHGKSEAFQVSEYHITVGKQWTVCIFSCPEFKFNKYNLTQVTEKLLLNTLRSNDGDMRQEILSSLFQSWWRHQMETFSALLALRAGKSPVTGEFPLQRPVTWSFDVFFEMRLNKRLSIQSWGWWFAMPSRSSWHHCNGE